MGAAASINTRDELALLTAEELGNKVAELGEEYVVYKDGFISKNIDGKAISALSQDERIQTLKDIGVENDAHQNALIAEFEKIKVTPAMEVSEETKTEEPASAEQKETSSEAKDEKNETAEPTETPSSKRMATESAEEISSAKRAATEAAAAVESIPEAEVTETAPAAATAEDVPMNTSPRVEVEAAPQEVAAST